MERLYKTRLFLAVLLFLLPLESVFAGFGITPPYVRNSSLTRNSVYQQTILLVRSDPTTDLQAEVTLDVPGINDWFTIEQGTTFLMPAGEQRVPMTVSVTVPDDADFKTYTGNIRVKTSSPNTGGGAVSISLGAQIDVEIEVIDKEIFDFRIRKITIHDLNEGHNVGWLYFPGKIRFDMLLENTGNVPVAPSDVVFRIYDPTGRQLLEETHHTNRIKKVEPFETDTVQAHLPTRLPSGAYLARYQIFNGEELEQSGEVNLNILPYGTLDTAGYGFWGLSLAHKVSILLPITVVLAIIILILIKRTNATSGAAPQRRRRRVSG